MIKFNKTKDWLIDEYVNKDRSRKEIADECGLTVAGLKSLLAKWNIKKEKLDLSKEILEELVNIPLDYIEIILKLGIGTTTLYRYLRKYGLKLKKIPEQTSKYDDSDDSIMCELYLDGFSSTNIAKEFGVTNRTVLNHLRHCNVPIRDFSEAQWTYKQKEFPKELQSRDSLYDLYVTQKLSKKDLGLKFNCDPCVIDRLLMLYKIPIRGNSEAHIGLQKGADHWNWKGGLTPLAKRLREYFKINLKPYILLRDNYTCLICGSKKNLHVHHIVSFSSIVNRVLLENDTLNPIENINELYDKCVNDEQFVDDNNLITYCQDCHYYKVHKFKRQADYKPCELLENLEPNSGEERYGNQQPSFDIKEGSTIIEQQN